MSGKEVPISTTTKRRRFTGVVELEDGWFDIKRLEKQLAAAREVIEAARRLVNNTKHDVDPVDVYELREAIKRYTDTEDELTSGAEVAAR